MITKRHRRSLGLDFYGFSSEKLQGIISLIDKSCFRFLTLCLSPTWWYSPAGAHRVWNRAKKLFSGPLEFSFVISFRKSCDSNTLLLLPRSLAFYVLIWKQKRCLVIDIFNANSSSEDASSLLRAMNGKQNAWQVMRDFNFPTELNRQLQLVRLQFTNWAIRCSRNPQIVKVDDGKLLRQLSDKKVFQLIANMKSS